LQPSVLRYELRTRIGRASDRLIRHNGVAHRDGAKLTIIAFDVGVLLRNATLPNGTSTLAFGKYVAPQRRGIS
jgi:hypothetical protein